MLVSTDFWSIWSSSYSIFKYLSLQVSPPSPPSPVLTSLEMVVELWMWLWTWLWMVETVLISTSSTLPPMHPRHHMGDFWTSPLPMPHNMNWQVSWQAMSTTSQYVVSTVRVRRGGRVSPWQLFLKVCITLGVGGVNKTTLTVILGVQATTGMQSIVQKYNFYFVI